jgi:hypothetical protein
VTLETKKRIAARLLESIGEGRIDENPFTEDSSGRPASRA